MLRALIVSRRGLIEIGQVRDDVNQCMNRGDRELDYTVEITADPDALDVQGFIIVAPKCVPASEADQSIFIEIIQPVKQEQFVSAYLVAR